MEEQSNLNIKWQTILKVVLAVVFLYLLYLLKDIIIWFIFAFIIAILFNYSIDFLEKKKIPRVAGTVILYFGIFLLLSFFIYKTAPIILSEIKEFSQKFPYFLQKISPFFEKIGIETFKSTEAFRQTLQLNLEKASGNILQALFSIFGGAISTTMILALAFFISLEKNLGEKIINAFPSLYQDRLYILWRRARQKVVGWFISRLIGVIFVWAASYLVLSILNVEYAFILSLLVGFLDFIPIIGPLIGGVIITVIIASTSLTQALFALIAFVLVQQLENNLLFPILFKKFVGISPVLVLIALAVGAKLWGVIGAILAIPLVGVLFEFLKDYLQKRKEATPPEVL
ncbi:MAG: AI-2E family transporter [Patescibacteria group bacterium]|nr:AI-2E family transporter [Patescibacteria group bacterium]